MKGIIVQQFKATLVFAFFAALVVIFLSPYALRIFGKEFSNDKNVIIIFACVAVCEVLAACLAQILVIYNKLWVQVANVSIWSLVLFATSAAFMGFCRPAIAIGIGYCFAWSISLVIYGAFARKLTAKR